MKFPSAALVLAASLVAAGSPASAQFERPPPAARLPPPAPSDAQISAMQNGPKASSAAAAVVKPSPADWLTPDPNDVLVIDTSKGRIVAELSPLVAPAHVARIQALARRHFYDGLTFFRVIEGFMDQTGDPLNSGKGGSDLPDLTAEFTFRRGADTPYATVSQPSGGESGFLGVMPVYGQAQGLMSMTADGKVSGWAAYCPGVLGMARDTPPDTANSQFFLMRDTYPALEKRYTAFGRVLTGMDAVRAIKVGEPPPDPQDRMVRVRLASDLPPSQRPTVQRLDPASPAFKAEVERARAERGADFSICDVQVPVRGG